MEASAKIKIAWSCKHMGEEPPLVGSAQQGAGLPAEAPLLRGAGGIFFCGCNLACVFCQNYQISQSDELGREYSVDELSDVMLDLQKQGAVNIDLVTPTIWWQGIKAAIVLAKQKGLTIPIVWNSNAYEPVGLIEQMKGLIDIYLPDFKYGFDDLAVKYSHGYNYVETADRAVRATINQVGLLKVENGLAIKGVIIRHLVLPNNLANTKEVLRRIAAINPDVHVSMMCQYNPLHRAGNFSELNRPLTAEEWETAQSYLEEFGLINGWVQELDSATAFVPDFTRMEPFGEIGEN